MADFMLDTTVFADYREGDPSAKAIIERVIAGESTASISSATVFELWGSAWFDRRLEIGIVGMLRFVEEAPITIEAAKLAGAWMQGTTDQDDPRLQIIALVAATAKTRGEPVITRQDDIFARFYTEIISY